MAGLHQWASLASDCQSQFVTWQSTFKCLDEILRGLASMITTPDDRLQSTLLTDLVAVFTVLQKAIASLKQLQPADKAEAFSQTLWTQQFLPMLDTCLFNVRWHTLVLDLDTTPKKELYHKIQNGVRETLKAWLDVASDSLTTPHPTLPDSNFPLLQSILNMAHTAAEVIGWRDQRTEQARSIRNYAVLNALWLAVTKIWTALAQHNAQLQTHDISVEDVVRQLGKYLEHDLGMLLGRSETADVKLLQFWMVQLSKLLTACPHVAVLVFTIIHQWLIASHDKAISLSSSNIPTSRAVLDAIEKGALWSRAGRLLVQALCALPPSNAPYLLDILHCTLVDPTATLGTAAAVINILGQAAAMTDAVQGDCVKLVKGVLTWIMSTGETGEICNQTVDAIIAFAVASCKAAASSGHPINSAWQDLQLSLIEASLQPHPVTAHVLRRVWLCLGTLSDVSTASQLIHTLSQLLTVVTAHEVAAAGYCVASPCTEQLVSGLAALLTTAPLEAVRPYLDRNLKLCPLRAEDVCYLASFAATLRTATLMGQRREPGATWSQVAAPSLGQLAGMMQRCVQGLMKGTGGQGLEVMLAWVCECAGNLLRFLAVDHVPLGPYLPDLHSMTSSLLDLLTKSSPATATPLPYTTPALTLLSVLWNNDTSTVTPDHLMHLLPALEHTFVNHTKCIAAVAGLTPAYKSVSLGPKGVFRALLTAIDPVVKHVGMEAYVSYIKSCEPGNVLGVLPGSYIDPNTRSMSSEAQAVVQEYLHRSASSHGPQVELLGSAGMKPWAETLRNPALNSVQTLCGTPKDLSASLAAASEVNRKEEAGRLQRALTDLGNAVSRVEDAWKGTEARDGAKEAVLQYSTRLKELVSILDCL